MPAHFSASPAHIKRIKSRKSKFFALLFLSFTISGRLPWCFCPFTQCPQLPQGSRAPPPEAVKLFTCNRMQHSHAFTCNRAGQETQQDVFFWEQRGYRLWAAWDLPYHLVPSLQSQQATQGWVMLDSTYMKLQAIPALAAQPVGTDSWVCAERAQAFRGYTAGQGCTDTLVPLSPVSGSTLLSLISIIREDVRREAGLISLSEAPCQAGNLCIGLGCTNRCTHRDWAFLTPCSQQVFHYAQELLPAAETCLVMWEQSGVPQFLMLLFWSKELQGSYISIHDAFSHCICLDRHPTLFLCMIFFEGRGSSYGCCVFVYFYFHV